MTTHIKQSIKNARQFPRQLSALKLNMDSGQSIEKVPRKVEIFLNRRNTFESSVYLQKVHCVPLNLPQIIRRSAVYPPYPQLPTCLCLFKQYSFRDVQSYFGTPVTLITELPLGQLPALIQCLIQRLSLIDGTLPDITILRIQVKRSFYI